MKKLNAKRTETEVKYEFLDGSETDLKVQSLSTVEFDGIAQIVKTNSSDSANEANKKTIRLLLVKNTPETVEKILKEQYEEGSLKDFAIALFSALNEEKAGKLND